MQFSAKPLSRAYDIFVITLSTGALTTVFVPAPTSQNSSFFTTMTWIVIYVITFFRTIRHRHRLAAIFKGSAPLLTIVGLCCLSVFWSIEKSITAHAVASLVFTTLIAIDLGLRYTQEDFLKTVAYTLIFLIIIGIPADFLFHGLIPYDDFDPSTVHGVFGTKNALGRVIVVALTAFLCLPKRSKIVTVLYIAANYALLATVHSTGAVVNSTIMLGVFLVLIALRWNRKARQIVLLILPVVVATGSYFAFTHLASITTSVGKDPSLTGRTVLWRLAIRSFFDRPILGYGWGAFWSKNAQVAWRIRQAANWPDAPHSHNGYIEMALGLGLVGLATLCTFYYKLGVKAYRYAVARQTSVSKWPLLYLIFFINYQISETTLVSGNNIFWLLLVQISMEVGRRSQLADQRTVPTRKRDSLQQIEVPVG